MVCEGNRQTAHVYTPPSQLTESQLKKRTFHEDSDDDEVVFEKTLVLERSRCLKILRNERIHML